jgi:hypothetical protein
MRRVLLGLAACALGLALSGSAEAHGGHRAPAPHHGPAYHHGHGVRFGGGYYYPGRNHPHWSYRVWDTRYHRYNYYDPSLRCFYYWYAPGACWYPVTYCP